MSRYWTVFLGVIALSGMALLVLCSYPIAEPPDNTTTTSTLPTGSNPSQSTSTSNSSGTSTESSLTVSLNTDWTAPSLPNDPVETNLTTEGISISWDTDEPAGCQLEYGEEHFVYSQGIRIPSNLPDPESFTTSHSQDLEGLLAGTSYDYYIVCIDAVYNQMYYGPFDFTTDISPAALTPKVIDGPTLTDRTKSQITLTWMTNLPTTTQVEYATTPGFTPGTGTLAPDPASDTFSIYHTLTIKGLSQSTTYYIDIQGEDTDSQPTEFAPPEPFDTLGELYIPDGWIGRGQTGWFGIGGSPSDGCENGQYLNPRGLTITDTRTMFLADGGNHRVYKIDLNGQRRIGWVGGRKTCCTCGADGDHTTFYEDNKTGRLAGNTDNRFNLPAKIGYNSSFATMFWVADRNNNRIVRRMENGYYDSWLGDGNATGYNTGSGATSGTTDGYFDGPWAVAVGSDGSLYITDGNNHKVQKWDGTTGTYVGSIGCGDASGSWTTGLSNTSGTGDREFNAPRGITLNSTEDRLFICDVDNHRIQIWSVGGSYIGWLGGGNSSAVQVGAAPAASNDNAEFNKPFDIYLDPSGTKFYVADGNNHRVQIWNVYGGDSFAYEGWLGGGLEGIQNGVAPSSGSGDGELNTPIGVAADIDFIYVSDYNNHRIQRWAK